MAAVHNATPRWRLSALLADLAPVPATADRELSGLALDSRELHPGDLFIALPGTATDGRRFVADAVRRGAVAVLAEGQGWQPPRLPVPVVPVHGLRAVVGKIADRFYGSPSRELRVIGVTGTNGKSTCTHLLAQALAGLPTRCAVIGTLGTGFPEALVPSVTTTPDAVSVHGLLAKFLQAGAAQVCMEVSSHALEQDRVAGVRFEIALLTNLSRDHLDYHGEMRRYAETKARLFDFPGLRCAILNRDDELGRALIERLRGRVRTLTFGMDAGDVRARAVRTLPEGLELHALTPAGELALRCPLYGRFNAANLLAVLACLLALGVGLETAGARLRALRPVIGRVERFGGDGRLPLVVVDYAHTPDALEQVLQALREHVQGRLICVFGCGGERDRGKRPEMGAVAERLADVVLLTDDNPRGEDGDRIIADILAGMRRPARVLRDRASAIRTALAEADARDVVLLAGKGHEDYQCVGSERLPYSDRDTVRRLLQEAA